ncbi:MAG: hypothetical protein UV64_C0007G0054 [Parcubacteria group bacterium GW2011_GWC1_43_11b]|nr:MAG: hypothetical protein UV64_C0007G0054 [Parcubacteria group bacterium GW2011_GWC1_43_11b]
MSTEIDYIELQNEIRKMEKGSKLFKFLRRELKAKGNWIDSPRGSHPFPRKRKRTAFANLEFSPVEEKEKEKQSSFHAHICPDGVFYTWKPRIENPQQCPRCKQHRKEILMKDQAMGKKEKYIHPAIPEIRTQIECPNCQHKWMIRREAKKRKCPRCQKLVENKLLTS